MPWADYECPGCPGLIRNHRFSAALGAKASAPLCPVCEIYMEPIPAIGRMDVGGVKGASFQAFEISRLVPSRHGMVEQTERIDSVHKLRAVERDSEQRYRDGEGEPVRFRAWNQDRSNLSVSSFGTSGRIGDQTYDAGQTPTKKPNITTKRHGSKKPDVKVARGAGKSPLKG